MTMFSESLRGFLKPISSYLEDDSVTEIMINGPEDIWVERHGQLVKTQARFSEEGLLAAVRNIAQFLGRQVWEEKPQLDARLPDGSRIHIVLPPVARRGVVITIRKSPKERLTLEDLLARQTLTDPMARLIEAATQMRLNVVVAGGTGSGRTTLLNVFSSIIPDAERVVTIEESGELQLRHRHLVSLETRLPDKSGRGGIDMADLLLSALRLRPDRIVIGEIRGRECFHFVQALNTGHGGSMCTCHASSPLDTLRRIESFSLIGAPNLPLVAVRAQIASAIGLIICCTRFPDGARRVTAISEVLALDEAGDYRTQDIFVYAPVHRQPDGTLLGYHSPTGIVPNFAEEARAFGFNDLSDEFFDPATYGLPAPPPFRSEHAQGVRWATSLKHREKGLPEPDALKVERSSWEANLRSGRTEKDGAVPIAAARHPRKGVDEDRTTAQRVSTRTVTASPLRSESDVPHNSFSMDQLLQRPENGTNDGPAFVADSRLDSKVLLSPDLVAEINHLTTPLEAAPPSGTQAEAVIPLPPNKDRR